MLPSHLLDLFSAQHGLAGLHQARLRLSANELRRLKRDPSVDRPSKRVFRHRAVPSSLGMQLMTAVLDAPGSVLWGRSAALWWGFGRDRDHPVHVGRIGGPLREPVARLHRLSDLDPIDTTIHRGIPIMRPERTILALAADETRRICPSRFRGRHDLSDVIVLAPAIRKMAAVLDHAWRLRIIDGPFLHAMYERLHGRGQAGSIVLRELLADRPPGYVPTDSRLELRFEELIGSTGRRLRRQVEMGDGLDRIGRVDYRAICAPLVIEINSERFHSTWTDRARDDLRYERFLASGTSVLVLWEHDIWQRPASVRPIVDLRLSRRDRRPTLHRPTAAPWELLSES